MWSVMKDLSSTMSNGQVILPQSVAISYNGLYVVFGNMYYPDGGAVSIFYRNDHNWVQLGYTIFGETDGDGFGYSVGIADEGVKMVAGTRSSNYVKVFIFSSDEWILQRRLVGYVGSAFGQSVSVVSSGSRIIVTSCSYSENEKWSVYIFSLPSYSIVVKKRHRWYDTDGIRSGRRTKRVGENHLCLS